MPYKWDTPYEWLEEKAREWEPSKLYHELLNLAQKVDSDTLQDEYQTDMDRDGYFAEKTENEEEEGGLYFCDACGEIYPENEGCAQHSNG